MNARTDNFILLALMISLLSYYMGGVDVPGHALTNGKAAILVIRQTDFTSAVSAKMPDGQSRPVGVAFDPSNVLWVSESLNRILKSPPFSTGMAASPLVGRLSFTIGKAATTSTALDSPSNVVLGSSGNLWGSEYFDNRVLEYQTSVLSLSVNFSYAPTAILVGDSATFTASASGGTAPYSFLWYFADTNEYPAGNPITHRFSSAGSFNVGVTVTDSVGMTAGNGHFVSVGSRNTTSTVVSTTSTVINCTPNRIVPGQSSTCTATVTDTSTTPTTPTGTVSFTSSGTGSLSSPSCTLTGTGAFASCIITYTAIGIVTPAKTDSISGNYNGDSAHAPSNGTTSYVTVTVTASNSPLLLYASGVSAAAVAIGFTLATFIKRRGKRKPEKDPQPERLSAKADWSRGLTDCHVKPQAQYPFSLVL